MREVFWAAAIALIAAMLLQMCGCEIQPDETGWDGWVGLDEIDQKCKDTLPHQWAWCPKGEDSCRTREGLSAPPNLFFDETYSYAWCGAVYTCFVCCCQSLYMCPCGNQVNVSIIWPQTCDEEEWWPAIDQLTPAELISCKVDFRLHGLDYNQGMWDENGEPVGGVK